MRYLKLGLALNTPAEQEGQLCSFTLAAMLLTQFVLASALLLSSHFRANPPPSLLEIRRCAWAIIKRLNS